MAVGTNRELLGKTSKTRESSGSKGGRPKVDRDLVIRHLKLVEKDGTRTYTNKQIAKIARCSTRTIKRIRDEAVKGGELTEAEATVEAIGIVEADFDAECQRAMGISFRTWVLSKFSNKPSGVTVFNFCSLVWEKVWEKPSMLDMAERGSQTADQMAQKFVDDFGKDAERMRGRLKQIRFLFRFIGRQDVMERHLKMTNTRHPRAKRKVPEITMLDFPAKLDECIQRMEEIFGPVARTMIRFKICTQMRTGNQTKDREFYGLKKGSDTPSYLLMNGPDDFRCHVLAKRREEWDVVWLPKEVRDELYKIYQEKERGDPIFGSTGYNASTFSKTWGKVTKKIIGRSLILHDCRKISITWFYVMGVPLEVATMLNVGWLDLSTARDHYLDIKSVLRKSYKNEYQQKIPEWFKEGLEEYIGQDAVVSTGSAHSFAAPTHG